MPDPIADEDERIGIGDVIIATASIDWLGCPYIASGAKLIVKNIYHDHMLITVDAGGIGLFVMWDELHLVRKI